MRIDADCHTAKEMHKAFAKQQKADLAQLRKELQVAIQEKENVRINQIAPRMRNQQGIPRHVAEQFQWRKNEIRRLKQTIERAENVKVAYKTYKEVISKFNLALIEAILHGYIFTIPGRLGKLSIKKVARKMDKPVINWPATHELKKKTGKWSLVYYIDDWWFRWYWEKKSCTIKNKTVYSFKPTKDGRNRNGAADKLSKLIKSDPYAHLKFEKSYDL